MLKLEQKDKHSQEREKYVSVTLKSGLDLHDVVQVNQF